MCRQFVKTGAGALLAFGVLAGCSLQQAATPQAGPSQPAGYEEHNDADVAFAQQMIPVEQRAVALSDALLAKQAADRDVTDIANAIEQNDRPEIAQMQGWLKEWGAPAADDAQRNAAELAASPDVASLKAADPGQAAQLYLRLMIANREQALALSKTENDDGTYRATVAAAGGNQATLERQITTMKTLLGSP
ncbi:DUF305 domain-containing protein [Mycolicibacterium aichiense]|uniref:DUF305 domain-containing protein n=1 Tax=Mycolicibacterium aichiense TaxID=1799 RepID=A0AAD1MAI2_9MYCO|nr:DUF305 domain-containing protein [Mycolicibacterium aichiense]MCV7018476.1 DUF305 domain-containing protein [Mycolicibacterium aichiense]BBX07232.1 DUF305 domain-containing protein [Mycolicibacterium aichiense]STZ81046.1 lipoprotein [Mycolicibacterium aichiense]